MAGNNGEIVQGSSERWSSTSKAAAIVFGLNVVLAGLKFVVFWLSGSLAVLAEAWHSFTDIATSALVCIAILVSGRSRGATAETDCEQACATPVSRMEIAASVCIGLLLLGISCLVFKEVLVSREIIIRNPLLSGIIFIIFSIASFLVSTFETHIGRAQASLGLVSDGMHAKADMFASLLTGFSLILYAMGVNLDKWMAGIIGFIILCLALDTFVNAYRVYRDRNGSSLHSYRFLTALLSVFSRQTLRQLSGQLHQLLVRIFGGSRKGTLLYRAILTAPLVVLVGLYGSTACYTVAVNESAIVERFGQPLNQGAVVLPGFHLKLPWPVDKAFKVSTFTIEKLSIGNVSSDEANAFIWTLKHGSEEAFLTGDNNFFYPYIILHYRVSNPYLYLYNYSDARMFLNETGHRAAVSLFAKKTFYDIATTERGTLQEKMKQTIQAVLDQNKSGIELISVNFKDIHPPISIAKSFENVVAGFQKKQELINQAISYANNVLPDSRGRAENQVQTAAADSVMRLSQALGKATRFELRLPSTRAEKQISMSRIYHETMMDALKNKTKIIVDPDAGTPDVWMDFSEEFIR